MENLKWNSYTYIGRTCVTYKAQDRFNFYIQKKYLPEVDNIYFDMETKSLEMLKGKQHFTSFLQVDKVKRIIYMDYLGNTLCKTNCPANWKEQVEEILDVLESVNLYISDFQKNNICILGKYIYLIDFGLVAFDSFDREALKSRLYFVFENLK